MRTRETRRRTFSAHRARACGFALAAALSATCAPSVAGVTGNITGSVKEPDGAPIAGVRVRAVSLSASRETVTDAAGAFVILTLPPDTYTLALSKDGYEGVSFPGVTVLADQTQALTLTMKRALQTIAHVTSGGFSLVKPGVGSDVYSVDAAQIAAAAPLGGGGNLNNAYSAMASVPGVQVSQGGIGWSFNAAYIRGQNAYYSGYEYDGVPVNRAFDNYNASTEPTLGLQELQVYTGGGPPSVATAGTAGFINEVIKTGTFPGYATANFGVATPAYYHQAQVEVGGSTPDRTFSYYAGFSGYNQTYRIIDNSNGAGYATPGGMFSGNVSGYPLGYGFADDQLYNVGYACLFGTCQGVKPVCPLYGAKFTFPDQGCWQYYSNTGGNAFMVSDRENVVNLHLGIPKGDGLRDDLQLLWSGSALNNYGYNSLNDLGPGVNQLIYSLYNTKYSPPICGNATLALWGVQSVLNGDACSSPGGSAGQIYSFLQPNQFFFGYYYGQGPYLCPKVPLACGPTYLGYADAITYNLPFGTPIARSPSRYIAPSVYFAPDTPAHAFDGPLPINDNSIDVSQNDTGIVKLQYTYALSSAAYLRAYGYSFYSDWLSTDPTAGSAGGLLPSFPGAAQLSLDSHTAGGALDFEDQIDGKNLISVDGNYTTSGVVRVVNSTAYGGASPIGYMALTGGHYTCYDIQHGKPVPCLALSLGQTYYDVNKKTYETPTWLSYADRGPLGWPASFAPAGSPAAKAGATWDTLWTSNLNGSNNTIRPRFSNAALQDQFRPNDKLTINAALRYDDFTYDLPDSLTAATQFYADMSANYTCVLAATNEVLTQKLAPGFPPPAAAQYVVGDCDQAAIALHPGAPKTGWVHPNGTVQDGVAAPDFVSSSPNAFSLTYWEPRFSATYTLNPSTVIRASAGRFTQPPIAASLQYLSLSGDDTSVWNSSMALGYYSPFHAVPGVSAAQYDVSWEQRFEGTDLSFKLTPFYTSVSDWQQETIVGVGFYSQIPVGLNRIKGIEVQVNKGDFAQNGFSGLLAFTYTDSKLQFENEPLPTGGVIQNQLIQLNAAIAQYDKLTKNGGGFPCYQEGTGVPCSTPNGKIASGYDTILNPYYHDESQPLLNESGWYNPFSVQVYPNLSGSLNSYISPYMSSLILNWRWNKLAVTPSFNYQDGGFYGSPLDTEGLDPRTCILNSATTGITKLSPKTNPLQCNYLYLNAPGGSSFVYLYVPNPQTGSFLFDNYQQPGSLVANIQLSYDITPRIRIGMLAEDVFHACFGGTAAPWTAANPPSYAVCGYQAAGGSLNGSLYPSNFYNGTGINDYRANGARSPWTQSYLPSLFNSGAIGAPLEPINLYLNAQVKL